MSENKPKPTSTAKKQVKSTMGRFYVYRHIRLDTNTPFYIGKGCGKRAWDKNRSDRSSYWHNVARKAGYRVEIVIKDLNESDAFQKEIEFIKLYRDLGYKLVNLTQGGVAPTHYNSDEASEVAFSVLSEEEQEIEIKSMINWLVFQSFKKDESSWDHWETVNMALKAYPTDINYNKLFNRIKHLEPIHLDYSRRMKIKFGDMWP